MKLRPPSWGFLYLASMVAAAATFFAFVTGQSWFDQTDPRQRLIGEAQYLYRLATKSTGAERWRLMNEALAKCLGLADAPRMQAILDELADAGVEPRFDPGAALVPGAVWVGGLTADNWTLGTQPALFLARNDDPSPARLVLRWHAESGERARFRRGQEDWQTFLLARDPADNLVRLEFPLSASSGFVLISVAAEVGFLPDNDLRELGIYLQRVELVR